MRKPLYGPAAEHHPIDAGKTEAALGEPRALLHQFRRADNFLNAKFTPPVAGELQRLFGTIRGRHLRQTSIRVAVTPGKLQCGGHDLDRGARGITVGCSWSGHTRCRCTATGLPGTCRSFGATPATAGWACGGSVLQGAEGALDPSEIRGRGTATARDEPGWQAEHRQQTGDNGGSKSRRTHLDAKVQISKGVDVTEVSVGGRVKLDKSNCGNIARCGRRRIGLARTIRSLVCCHRKKLCSGSRQTSGNGGARSAEV